MQPKEYRIVYKNTQSKLEMDNQQNNKATKKTNPLQLHYTLKNYAHYSLFKRK